MVSTIEIAKITVKEIIRKKILYIILFMSLIFIASSTFLPSFDLGVQIRLLKDVALTCIELFGLVLCIGLTINLIPAEIHNKTIYPILSRPVRRFDFLVGKFFAVLCLVTLNLCIMTIELLILVYMIENVFDFGILKAVLLLFFEASVIIALVLMFSTVISLPLNISLTLIIFVCGQISTTYFQLLTAKWDHPVFTIAFDGLRTILPHFEYFHIKDALVHNFPVSSGYMILASGYGVLYTLFILLVGYLFFRKKEL